MKIMICSDTHGNSTLFQQAIDMALSLGATHIWHLGDDWDDVALVDTKGLVVKQVPGLWHAHYHNPNISRIYSYDFSCFSTTMVHDIATIRPMFLNPAPWIFLYGHSHHPSVVLESPTKLLINPGHLKKSFDRGAEATFMLLSPQKSGSELILEQCHPESGAVLGTVRILCDSGGFTLQQESSEWYRELRY